MVYEVTFDRTSKDVRRLGLMLRQRPGGRVLSVDALTEGLAMEWNQRNAEAQIQVGDIVLEVNGIRQDTLSMMDRFRVEGKLHMTFQRRPRGGKAAERRKAQ